MHTARACCNYAHSGRSWLKCNISTYLRQLNCERLQALGLGEVNPEAPPNRKKGQTYTRAGMRNLINKVSSWWLRTPATRPQRACISSTHPNVPLTFHVQVVTTPSFAAAAERIGAEARLEAEMRPPLALAVQEVELAMAHRNYGLWRPYSVIPAPNTTSAGLASADEL